MNLRTAFHVALAAVAWGAACAAPAMAGETLYVEAMLVIPVEGPPIEGGRIIVRDGRIVEVGKDLQRPPFSRFVDARSATITPGFVVPMSLMGMPTPERSEPGAITMSPATKASDEVYPLRPEYAYALESGVTTLGLLPAPGGVGILGQAAAIIPRAGRLDAMTVTNEGALVVAAASHGTWREAMTSALEEARKTIVKEDGKSPSGPAAAPRRRSLDTTRQAASRARGSETSSPSGAKSGAKPDAKPGANASPMPSGKSGGKSGKRAGGSDAKKKKPERSKDPLVRALRGQQPVLLVPRSPAGWVALRDVLPLAGVDASVVDGSGFDRLAEQFKEAGVRVVTWPVLTRLPRTRQPLNRAAEYERAGVPYAFALPSDDPRGAADLRDALIAMRRTGCDSAKVLAAATLEAAKALGVADKVGSIAPGRRADLLFWSGDPLDPLSRLERVMVGGDDVPRMPATTGGTP